MGKFFTTLILLGGIAGVFVVTKDYFASQKVKSNPWIEDLRKLIVKQSADEELTQVEDPWFADEGRFFRILSLMYETERGKYSAAETLLSAASAGLRPGEAKMVAESLLESYQLAKQLGVFDEPNNLLLMERGEAPVATSKGWEEEKLAVGHRVSPVLAPEASRSLVNLVLMPESLRDMQSDKVTSFTTDTIKKWRSENIITPESADAIAQIIMPASAR